MKCTQQESADTARVVYQKMDTIFQRSRSVSLVKAMTTVKELNIQTKKSKTEMKKERRDNLRKTKASLEEQWKNTAVMR